MLAAKDIRQLATENSPAALVDHVKGFLNRLIEKFILNLRMYAVDRL